METASKKWRRLVKDGKTSLSFKDWVSRENIKGESKNTLSFDTGVKPPSFDYITDTLNSSLDESQTNIKKKESSGKILGLDTKIFIFSTLLIAGSLTYYFVKKRKK